PEVGLQPALVLPGSQRVRCAGAGDELVDAGGERGVAHGPPAEALDAAVGYTVGHEEEAGRDGAAGERAVPRRVRRADDGERARSEGQGVGEVALDVEDDAHRARAGEIGLLEGRARERREIV